MAKGKQYFANARNERAFKELVNFKHRDLQRACIVRGLEFENIVKFGHPKLAEWFTDNYDNTQNENLLILYDAWVEEQLKARGYKEGDTLLSPALKFSFVGDPSKMERINPKAATPILPNAEKKPKAEIDTTTGVRKGTKKAMTYDLSYAGKTPDEIILAVKEAFPDAEEKSIKIWHKRALKEKLAKGTK